MSVRFGYTKNQAWKLFLVCAAPAHLWTIFSIINEAELISKRNWWYYGGYSGYLLSITLIDSILLFLFVVLISFLFPKKWEDPTPFAVAAAISLVISLWAVANQLFFFLDAVSPDWFSWIMLRVHYRQHQVYPLLVALVALSAAAPIYAVSQNTKIRNSLLPLLDNLSLLSYLYLFVDVCCIVIMLVRNIY